MRKKELRFIVVGIAVATLLTGCYTRRVYVRETKPVYTTTRQHVYTEPSTRVYTSEPSERIVYVEPPAPRHEVIGKSPSPNHVWVDGYWTHRDGKWRWVTGHWESRPRPGADYVPGHWEKTNNGRGWIWMPGHWE
jgi:hypothetical protein